jgi:hypothetical protein
MAWAEDRAIPARREPERRPRDQDRRGWHDAALSYPFGIGTKALNRIYIHQVILLRISRHQFLHFTVNQYRSETCPLLSGNGTHSNPVGRVLNAS